MITFRTIQEELNEATAPQQSVTDQKIKPAEFVSRCRAASTAAHFAHLTTPSYAQHKILNKFYINIVNLVDVYAESFMGRYGRFESFPNVRENSLDGLTIVGNLCKWIDANREMLGEFQELQANIDDILTLCNKSANNLRELK